MTVVMLLMGHELIIYGVIEGAVAGQRSHSHLHGRNEAVIESLPETDDWPWLTRAMFQLPAGRPQGTYRTQIIHFGLSMKDGIPLNRSGGYDDGYHPIHSWRHPARDSITGWIEKFETLLRQMYWFGADVHVHTDFEPDRKFSYVLTDTSFKAMCDPHDPKPINDWTLSVTAT